MTVLLSSHLLAEVEEVCDRVAIIRSGRIVYEGALAALKRAGESGYRLRTTDDARAVAICAAQAGLRAVRREGVEVRFSAEEEAVAQLSVALVEAGVAITQLTPELATLEDLFFRFTEDEPGAGGAHPPADVRAAA
jgi:ABC-2 type transport system ATP-binding protein